MKEDWLEEIHCLDLRNGVDRWGFVFFFFKYIDFEESIKVANILRVDERRTHRD